MKKIITVFVCLALLFVSVFAVSSAGKPQLSYKESYDKGSSTVTVTVSIYDAVGISSGFISLCFDPSSYSFVKDSYKQLANSNIISEGGKTYDNDYECACAFMTSVDVTESDCDSNGNIELCSFKFKLLGKSYSENSFALSGSDFYIGDNEVAVVTAPGVSVNKVPGTTKSSGKGQSDNSGNAPVDEKDDNSQDKQGNKSNSTGENLAVSESESITDIENQVKSGSKSGPVFYILIVVIVVAAIGVVAVIVTKKKKTKIENE